MKVVPWSDTVKSGDWIRRLVKPEAEDAEFTLVLKRTDHTFFPVSAWPPLPKQQAVKPQDTAAPQEAGVAAERQRDGDPQAASVDTMPETQPDHRAKRKESSEVPPHLIGLPMDMDDEDEPQPSTDPPLEPRYPRVDRRLFW